MIVTRKHLHRRTFLRGLGSTLALPLLDAMVPAMTAMAATAANPVRRLGFVYMPMGAHMPEWTPAGTGKIGELSATLKSLARRWHRPSSAQAWWMSTGWWCTRW